MANKKCSCCEHESTLFKFSKSILKIKRDLHLNRHFIIVFNKINAMVTLQACRRM